MIRIADLLRYVLWLAVLYTAAANRAYYRMRSTWLPHGIGNTVVLLLPDAVRLVNGAGGWPAPQPHRSPLRAVWCALGLLLGRRLPYALYVAPFAIGYILSHPERNIYKGELARKRFLGLGLDAIPHAATAFGFSALAADGLAELSRHTAPRSPVAGLAAWGSRHAALASGLALALVTACWEASEYVIHVEELRQKGGRAEAINMQWSVEDSVADVAANAIGWLAAMLLRRFT